MPDLPLRELHPLSPGCAAVVAAHDPEIAPVADDVDGITRHEGRGMHQGESRPFDPSLPTIVAGGYPPLVRPPEIAALRLRPRELGNPRSPEVAGGDETSARQAQDAGAVAEHALRIGRPKHSDVAWCQRGDATVGHGTLSGLARDSRRPTTPKERLGRGTNAAYCIQW